MVCYYISEIYESNSKKIIVINITTVLVNLYEGFLALRL
jgi:hypothetical protein